MTGRFSSYEKNARQRNFTKKDHIKYWVDTANKDWLAIKKMLECRSYIHALFFMHLLLEKLLKAHWVKDNVGNHPPKIHDLKRLLEQTNLQMNEEQVDELRQMNLFQLEGRYPEHQQKLYKICKKKQTFAKFVFVNSIRKCLLKKLQ